MKITEENLQQRLRYRYTKLRGGFGADRFVRARQVRYPNPRYGGDALSIADYIVADTYSDGELLGFEIKTSRSDWLNELRNPEKSLYWKQYCNRWFLVASSKDIVKEDLPEGWGLMIPGKDGRLRVSKQSPLHQPKPLPTKILASFARSVAKNVVWEQNHPLPSCEELFQLAP